LIEAFCSKSARWRTDPTETDLAQRTSRDWSSSVANRGELHHLVDAELSDLQCLGDPRQVLEGVARGDPASGLPFGDAVADGEQVRGVARSGIAPDLGPIRVRDQLEQLSLHPTYLRVDIVECSKQWVRLDLEHECDANTRH
jgi:hypothetical protein